MPSTNPTLDEFTALQSQVDSLTSQVNALDGRVTALENAATQPPIEPPPSGPVASADGAKTSTPGEVLIDDGLNSWRLTSSMTVEWLPAGSAADAWGAAGYTADVIVLEKWKGTAYQQAPGSSWSPSGWWQWMHGSNSWSAASGDPSAGGGGSGGGGNPSGAYSVANGKIYQPDGQVFVANGVCLLDLQCANCVTGPDCRPLLDWYPTLTYVHLMPWGWTGYAAPLPAAMDNAVQWLTAKGIVVEIGDWTTWPAVPTGPQLAQKTAWVAALATQYLANPRVWFTTCNEPQDTYLGAPYGSVSAEHKATYDAIRGTGSQAIIGLVGIGGVTANGLDAGIGGYAGMHGVHWDEHYYGWMSNYSADLETNKATLRNYIADVQRIQSADGLIPIIVGEFGNATDGAHIDNGAYQIVQAVLDVSRPEYNGCAAFCCPFWSVSMGGSPGADWLLYEDTWQMTDYGQQVQAGYASPAAAVAAPMAAPAEAAPTGLTEGEWAELRGKVAERLRAVIPPA